MYMFKKKERRRERSVKCTCSKGKRKRKKKKKRSVGCGSEGIDYIRMFHSLNVGEKIQILFLFFVVAFFVFVFFLFLSFFLSSSSSLCPWLSFQLCLFHFLLPLLFSSASSFSSSSFFLHLVILSGFLPPST